MDRLESWRPLTMSHNWIAPLPEAAFNGCPESERTELCHRRLVAAGHGWKAEKKLEKSQSDSNSSWTEYEEGFAAWKAHKRPLNTLKLASTLRLQVSCRPHCLLVDRKRSRSHLKPSTFLLDRLYVPGFPPVHFGFDSSRNNGFKLCPINVNWSQEEGIKHRVWAMNPACLAFQRNLTKGSVYEYFHKHSKTNAVVETLQKTVTMSKFLDTDDSYNLLTTRWRNSIKLLFWLLWL